MKIQGADVSFSVFISQISWTRNTLSIKTSLPNSDFFTDFIINGKDDSLYIQVYITYLRLDLRECRDSNAVWFLLFFFLSF